MPKRRSNRRESGPRRNPAGGWPRLEASAETALARYGSWGPWGLSLVSGLLIWAALPPLNAWLLGWVGPLGYVMLIRAKTLPGRRPYSGIFFASVLCWALTMQGIRLAHGANYLGLAALALYLGIHVPLFIAVARVAYHRWRIPLMISSAVAWVGIEVARGYGPLGFSVALLGHTQVEQPVLIQISDLFGPYSVSFVIMLVAASLSELIPRERRGFAWWPLVCIAILLVLTWGYGRYRLAQAIPGEQSKPLRVALIQGSIDTEFNEDPDRPRRTYEQYNQLTREALERFGKLDLVMWPETMFPLREVLLQEPLLSDPDSRLHLQLLDQQEDFQRLLEVTARQLGQTGDAPGERHGASWVLGTATWKIGPDRARRYNTALLVDSQANILGRYYKMHPVIFGEYVPFGDMVPALYNLFPLPNGLSRGPDPVAWDVNGLTLSPSICFENTMPHLIRRQVVELTRRGQRPDVLINLTNDGWFWGSSILDMQLNCAVFQAVQLRRPFLIAANTGFSAWIDGNGTVLAKGPRRALGIRLARVVPDGRKSWYEMWGDTPALCCTFFCLLAAVAGIWSRRPRHPIRSRSGTEQGERQNGDHARAAPTPPAPASSPRG
ncbi:MAG: apolipoprotein N-acyltransferase [Planctomycetota bacterium]